MEVLPLINQKGGVGKTTSVINIAAILAALSYRVLVIDMDVQGNLSHGIKAQKSDKRTVFQVLNNETEIDEVINTSYLPNIHIIPSSMHLATLDTDDLLILKKKLGDINTRYDYVLIDCPPSLGIPMVLSLLASTEILIPIQCEYFAVKGLVSLLNLIRKIERQYKMTMNIAGILPTMFDQRSKIMRDIFEKLKNSLDVHVFDTIIPRSTRVVESNSCGQPVVLFDTNCGASKGYLEFVKEFLGRKRSFGHESLNRVQRG